MTVTSAPAHASPLTHVTAGSAMHPGVITVASNASMEFVARTMTAHGGHAVLVRPNDPRELGWPSRVVTDRDVIRWAVDGAPSHASAGDAASERAGLVLLDWPLERAAQLMRDLGEGHLLVADKHSLL